MFVSAVPLKVKLVLVRKDTETAVCDAEVPHIDAQVIGRQVGLPIAIN